MGEEEQEFWQTVIPVILATDAANKSDDEEFDVILNTNSYNRENKLHRHLLMRQLIRLCDVSNIAKPWPICKHWAETVSTEFYAQGDLERERGMPVTPFMDRTVTPLAK